MLAFISNLLNKFIWRIRPIEETRSVSEIGSEQVHRLWQSQAMLIYEKNQKKRNIIMGRKSTKENKNIYQISRENMEYSRDAAAEKMGFISSDRIEKIENEKSLPHPEEVLAMAGCYKNPSLCNYFCSHECPIGIEYVPEIKEKALSQITLEMLATLNKLVREKDRLIEITVDGELSEDELPDFLKIKEELKEMSLAIDSLNLWMDQTIASGKIDKDLLPEDFRK